MKTIVIILAILIAGYLILDYQAGKFLDENLKEFDIGELIMESCNNNSQCKNATSQYYSACKPESNDLNSEEYFKALEDTINCIQSKSGVDINSIIEG